MNIDLSNTVMLWSGPLHGQIVPFDPTRHFHEQPFHHSGRIHTLLYAEDTTACSYYGKLVYVYQGGPVA